MVKKAPGAGIVYLSNPHLPYGKTISKGELEAFIRACSPTPVLVDEAYIHFVSEDHEKGSCIPLVDKVDNLIVTRTFSKMFGLAGLRLGYSVSSQKMIYDSEWLDRESNPLACAAGLGALQDHEFMKKTRTYLSEARSLINQFCKNQGWSYAPSLANFYTLRFQGLSKNSERKTF